METQNEVQNIANEYKSKSKRLSKKSFLCILTIALIVCGEMALFIYGNGLSSGDSKLLTYSRGRLDNNDTYKAIDTVQIAKQYLKNNLNSNSLISYKQFVDSIDYALPNISTIHVELLTGYSFLAHIQETIRIIYYSSSNLFLGTISFIFSLFFIHMLSKMSRYYTRLSQFYNARSIAIRLAAYSTDFKFEKVTTLLTPDTYDFHPPKYPERIFELIKIALENSTKCCCKEEKEDKK